MIAIVGNPIGRSDAEDGGVAGTAGLAAIAAARAGARVELVGKVGDDAMGDAVVLALGQAGVGHAAILRDAGRATPVLDRGLASRTTADDAPFVETEDEAADDALMEHVVEPRERGAWPSLEPEDVTLALRYLPDIRGIIAAERLPDPVLEAIANAGAYLEATIILVDKRQDILPAADVVLAPPMSDPDGAFAGMLGELAAALDKGRTVAEAFEELGARMGVSPAG